MPTPFLSIRLRRCQRPMSNTVFIVGILRDCELDITRLAFTDKVEAIEFYEALKETKPGKAHFIVELPVGTVADNL